MPPSSCYAPMRPCWLVDRCLFFVLHHCTQGSWCDHGVNSRSSSISDPAVSDGHTAVHTSIKRILKAVTWEYQERIVLLGMAKCTPSTQEALVSTRLPVCAQ